MPVVHHVPEFSTLVLPTNLPLTTSANPYSSFLPQSLSMSSVQNIPAAQHIPELSPFTPVPSTNLLPTISVKSYPYFSNSHFKQNSTEAKLIKEKWPPVHWAYKVKGGCDQKNRWEKASCWKEEFRSVQQCLGIVKGPYQHHP